MKTTNALAASIGRFLANLHPPSPPTARESQQLLNVLQRSFKDRLDKQHPAPFLDEASRKSHDQDNIPTGLSTTSLYATSTHLNSILARPVLASLDGLRTCEDAILRFEKLVAEPELDLSRLAGLLRWCGREATTSRQPDLFQGFSDRLNRWLHVTDRPSREVFLSDARTRKAALNLLHLQRNETVLWTWLRIVYERRLVQAPITSSHWLDVEDDFVSSLMRLSIQKKDIADAAQQFLEACRYRVDSGRGTLSDSTGQTQARLFPSLKTSGRRLASAIVFHRHQHGIESDVFDNILKYLPSGVFSSNANFEFCAVYSPQNPTVKYLHELLKNNEHARQLVKDLKNSKPEYQKITLISLLDGSRLALDQGKKREASFILDFAVDNFPEYLPARIEEELAPEIGRYLNLVPG